MNVALELCDTCNRQRLRAENRKERMTDPHERSKRMHKERNEKRKAYCSLLCQADTLGFSGDDMAELKALARPYLRIIEDDLDATGDLAPEDDDLAPEDDDEVDRLTATESPCQPVNPNLIQESIESARKPKLNPDGVSVKGCTIIYAPAGQAGEYSPLAANPYSGCGHGCAYCYVPAAIHMLRSEFDAGAIPRQTFLERLEKDARKYQALGITEQVMLSFTTDPYHPGDTALTRDVIKMIQQYGMGICTLTKGGSRALRDLDLFRPDRDAFASTLTSLDDVFSAKWERNAAPPADRIATLRAFHDAGIYTWVSLEPVLDTAATLEIIRRTHTFVDLYKIGRVNYIGLTKTTDWRQFTADVLSVLAEIGAKSYIKRDLQPYLPEGYENPMRVPQFTRNPAPTKQREPGRHRENSMSTL